MSDQELKDSIREQTRLSIQRHINGNTQEDNLNESLLLGLAAMAGLGGAWAWARSASKQIMRERHLRSFIDQYDNEKIIERQIPDLLKRFKLVNSVADLDLIESRLDGLLSRVSSLTTRVDDYVNTIPTADVSSSALALNPQRQKKDITKFIKEFISNTEKSFKIDAESKRDQVLA